MICERHSRRHAGQHSPSMKDGLAQETGGQVIWRHTTFPSWHVHLVQLSTTQSSLFSNSRPSCQQMFCCTGSCILFRASRMAVFSSVWNPILNKWVSRKSWWAKRCWGFFSTRLPHTQVYRHMVIATHCPQMSTYPQKCIKHCDVLHKNSFHRYVSKLQLWLNYPVHSNGNSEKCLNGLFNLFTFLLGQHDMPVSTQKDILRDSRLSASHQWGC